MFQGRHNGHGDSTAAQIFAKMQKGELDIGTLGRHVLAAFLTDHCILHH